MCTRRASPGAACSAPAALATPDPAPAVVRLPLEHGFRWPRYLRARRRRRRGAQTGPLRRCPGSCLGPLGHRPPRGPSLVPRRPASKLYDRGACLSLPARIAVLGLLGGRVPGRPPPFPEFSFPHSRQFPCPARRCPVGRSTSSRRAPGDSVWPWTRAEVLRAAPGEVKRVQCSAPWVVTLFRAQVVSRGRMQ